jgi:hypothetical protein
MKLTLGIRTLALLAFVALTTTVIIHSSVVAKAPGAALTH